MLSHTKAERLYEKKKKVKKESMHSATESRQGLSIIYMYIYIHLSRFSSRLHFIRAKSSRAPPPKVSHLIFQFFFFCISVLPSCLCVPL